MKSAFLVLGFLLTTTVMQPRALAQEVDASDLKIAQQLVDQGYYTQDQLMQAYDKVNKLNSNELNDAKALVDDKIIATFDAAANIVWRSDAQDRTCARIHLHAVDAHDDFVTALHLCELSRWDD